MSVEIDSLFIKVETNSSRAVTAIEELIRTLERLKTVAGLDRVSESMERVSKSIHKVSEESKESSKSANKLSHSLASVAKGLAGIIANAFAINTVGEFLGKAYAAAVEWDGISSRFGDGFGEQADEVYAYVMKLSNALYINDQAFMKYAGNFATLARGFGVAEENIAAMSVGLTEMAYDIYAKNNDFYTFEEAMDAANYIFSEGKRLEALSLKLLLIALERQGKTFDAPIPDGPDLARQMSRRRFSVGGDGLVLILPSEIAAAVISFGVLTLTSNGIPPVRMA